MKPSESLTLLESVYDSGDISRQQVSLPRRYDLFYSCGHFPYSNLKRFPIGKRHWQCPSVTSRCTTDTEHLSNRSRIKPVKEILMCGLAVLS